MPTGVYERTPVSSVYRFLQKIEINEETGCWLWVGSVRNSGGYGNFWADGHHITAHRFSYEFFVESIPKGMQVCHTCDMRRCVNPDHLWLGTNKENNQDMLNKGRHVSQNKTHCKRGHVFTVDSQGKRQCNLCRKIRDKQYYYANVDEKRSQALERYYRKKSLTDV